MSFRRLLTVTRKELRHIVRDGRTFFLVTVAPAFLLFTLSYVFAFDVEHVSVAVVDLDRSSLSRDLLVTLTADDDVSVVTYGRDVDAVDDLFARGVVDLALVIPHGFARAVREGNVAQIQSIVDGSDAIAARQAANIIESRIGDFEVDLRRRQGRAQIGVTVSARAWYNEGLESLVSMVPGMMAVIMSMPALALALALTREKETGSFESLIVTPVRGVEYLLGKLIAYEMSGMFSVVLAWLVATVWFRIPFRGSLPGFLLLAADYLLVSMGIGLVIANFVRNQQTAMFLILTIFFVPSFFVTGLILPVAEDTFSQVLAFLLPTTHFITISRAVFLKGSDVFSLWESASILFGGGIMCVLFSLALFSKKLP
ncbi:MAG TPA: ABC transporter permease [Chloroflexi bacterium]|nr:ABC transporter permease [Chloroflexota bacterium]